MIKRLTQPSKTNKYYLHTSVGGLNECIKRLGGSCLPNCVGYAWGRAYEYLGIRPNLSRGNAEVWYNHSDGYPRGKTAMPGSIACWSKTEGAGHVCFVEEVKENGDVVTSNSNYSGTTFYLKTYKKGNMYITNSYHFQGFIYLGETPKNTENKQNFIYKYGDKHENIGKIAQFMRKVFPLYTDKKALGNVLGKYLSSSVKEFQKRTKLNVTGNIDEETINKMKEYGLKL